MTSDASNTAIEGLSVYFYSANVKVEEMTRLVGREPSWSIFLGAKIEGGAQDLQASSSGPWSHFESGHTN
jgi:hypothetical protein